MIDAKGEKEDLQDTHNDIWTLFKELLTPKLT
jgi:hypothetical protein